MLITAIIVASIVYFYCWVKVYKNDPDGGWFLLVPFWFFFVDAFSKESQPHDINYVLHRLSGIRQDFRFAEPNDDIAEAGVTQQELAVRAGTSQSTVAAYEWDTKSPTLRTIEME